MSSHLRKVTSLYRNKLAHWLEEQFQKDISVLLLFDTQLRPHSLQSVVTSDGM